MASPIYLPNFHNFLWFLDLQGSGKTTFSGKTGLFFLKTKKSKKPFIWWP